MTCPNCGELLEFSLEDEEDEEEDEEDEEDEWDDEWDDEEECDGDCLSCDGCDCADEEYFEIVCPSCGETVCFDDSVNAEDLICPACGSELGCIVDDDDIASTEE